MKRRLLTGDRPTGKLHLGHYVGSLKNRLKLQDEYGCFFIIADLHMLTTHIEPEKLKEIPQNIKDILLDYLSCGIDPTKSTIYLQSCVPEVTEFFLLFSMLVSIPRVERIPTLKDTIRDLKIENPSLGLLSYPVLQTADILMVRAEVVPVGKDQASHIELSREIARRFNYLYGEVFPEPQALIGEVPTLVGIDGKKKMSKSLGNCIYLSDSEDEVKNKVMKMYTDPRRIHPDIPGEVEGNPVFIYHDAFNDNREEVEDLKRRYKMGKVGDVEVKDKLTKALNRFLEPIRKKRREYEDKPETLLEIIQEGSKIARKEAQETLKLMKDRMGLKYRL